MIDLKGAFQVSGAWSVMYNNLLYFLTAIFLFSMNTAPETPGCLPGWLVFFLS